LHAAGLHVWGEDLGWIAALQAGYRKITGAEPGSTGLQISSAMTATVNRFV